MVPKLSSLPNYQHRILDADLLLCRPTSMFGWIVARLSDSPYCHAAKAAWKDGVLGVVETVEGGGGGWSPLDEQVAKWPGKIDHFRTNPENRWSEYDRDGSVRWSMANVPDTPYGWWPTIRAMLTRAIVIRWFLRSSWNDEANGTQPPNCSAACSMADRIGGKVDPVNHLSDYSTVPSDLARSPFYEYQHTLI